MEKVTCVCGSQVLQKNMSIHVKTSKHLKKIGQEVTPPIFGSATMDSSRPVSLKLNSPKMTESKTEPKKKVKDVGKNESNTQSKATNNDLMEAIADLHSDVEALGKLLARSLGIVIPESEDDDWPSQGCDDDWPSQGCGEDDHDDDCVYGDDRVKDQDAKK